MFVCLFVFMYVYISTQHNESLETSTCKSVGNRLLYSVETSQFFFIIIYTYIYNYNTLDKSTRTNICPCNSFECIIRTCWREEKKKGNEMRKINIDVEEEKAGKGK